MFQFVSRVYFLGVNIRRIKLYLCQHQLSKHDTYAVLNKFFFIPTVSVPLQSLLCNKQQNQFSPSTLAALSAKSHLSIIHEMKNYPFTVL